MGDLATANNRPCDRVAAFFQQLEGEDVGAGGGGSDAGVEGRRSVAAEVLKTLASNYPDSAGYDPVVTMFLLNSAALPT
eukprot:CAMPEP_0198272312 /NCGR_PEP_ID=MMETSP1447-20131203/52715_1 /TAXON_ID=420782 /ORGANISM="Chaetoceros dichaeta, Strain CCMP1751" /LENGTH=78 /DNA_ID=CAMNT_0043965417 /DNA_START=1 /DNA_END=233 /DNA_ORIENTATION=+